MPMHRRRARVLMVYYSLPTAAGGLAVGGEGVEKLHEAVGVVFEPSGNLVALHSECGFGAIVHDVAYHFVGGAHGIAAVAVAVGGSERLDGGGGDAVLQLGLQATGVVSVVGFEVLSSSSLLHAVSDTDETVSSIKAVAAIRYFFISTLLL